MFWNCSYSEDVWQCRPDSADTERCLHQYKSEPTGRNEGCRFRAFFSQEYKTSLHKIKDHYCLVIKQGASRICSVTMGTLVS